MYELFVSVILFGLLVGSAWSCLWLQQWLPRRHRSQETTAFVQLVITMTVTFAAVALGLLISAAKADFDSANNDLRRYAVEIIELSRLLRAYGPDTAQAEALLREYTAGVIATTWPQETPPPDAIRPPRAPWDASEENSALGNLLTRIGLELSRLQPSDPPHQRFAAAARSRFESLMQTRWKLIEEAPGQISTPFFLIMGLWLLIVFASFGLIAPRNELVAIIIGLCAVSIASAMFVVLEMNTPFSGLIVVPSAPMRQALVHLNE